MITNVQPAHHQSTNVTHALRNLPTRNSKKTVNVSTSLPIPVSRIYKLLLKNTNPYLNIGGETLALNGTISHILMGGKSRQSFRDVISINIVRTAPSYIELQVVELGTNWHKYIGKFLANNYGLRHYCNPTDPSEMFHWI